MCYNTYVDNFCSFKAQKEMGWINNRTYFFLIYSILKTRQSSLPKNKKQNTVEILNILTTEVR